MRTSAYRPQKRPYRPIALSPSLPPAYNRLQASSARYAALPAVAQYTRAPTCAHCVGPVIERHVVEDGCVLVIARVTLESLSTLPRYGHPEDGGTGWEADDRERNDGLSCWCQAVFNSNISSAMLTNLRILLYHLRTTWALFHSRVKLLAFNCTFIRPHNKSMGKSYDKYRRSIYPPKNKRPSLSLCDGCRNKSDQHCNYKNFHFTTPYRPYSLPPVDQR